MEIELTANAVAFQRKVGEYLEARLERGLLATVLASALPATYENALFAAGLDEASGEVVAVALRTPPRLMLATGFTDDGSAAALLDAWLDADPDLPGVGAEPMTADAVGRTWQQRMGGRVELETEMGMHVLTNVRHPSPKAPGRLRRAQDSERDLLIKWVYEFFAEVHSHDATGVPASVDRALSARGAYLWETEHGPAALVVHSPEIAGTRRIGPVYTPPALRGNGYATAATAELSQLLLDDGADRCMLFTDLANPTSNKIYASIGYSRIGDWREIRFDY
jgi:uncharacterized protein